MKNGRWFYKMLQALFISSSGIMSILKFHSAFYKKHVSKKINFKKSKKNNWDIKELSVVVEHTVSL